MKLRLKPIRASAPNQRKLGRWRPQPPREGRKGDGGFGGEIQRIVKVDRSGVSDGLGKLDSFVTNWALVEP